MKTITFDNIEPANENAISRVKERLSVKAKQRNGLFDTLYYGYSYHVPILIRPDDILNNIASVWSKYIAFHAEKFRDFFVQHDGKKELVYVSGGTYSDDRMPEFRNGLINLIIGDQADDKLTWATGAKFSTTEEDDMMVRATAILASQKEYYQYGMTLMCGFPKIELAGTEEDWCDLVSIVNKMPSPDEEVYKWKQKLIETIDSMVEGTENFWQSCVTSHPYGSGGQSKKDGWIVAFNPINENGAWVDLIEDDGVLDLYNKFNVNVNDNGNEFELVVQSGPIMAQIDDDSLHAANKTRFIKRVLVK